MVVHTLTFAMTGLEAKPVHVEAQMTGGEFGMFLVGLPNAAVRESRDRIRGAFHAMGLSMPPKRITINLSPADVANAVRFFMSDASGFVTGQTLAVDGGVSALTGG